MARSPLLIAATIKAHLDGIHALEAETMALVKDFGEGPTNAMRGFFNQIDAAHKHADRAAKQIPEIAPQFGSK